MPMPASARLRAILCLIIGAPLLGGCSFYEPQWQWRRDNGDVSILSYRLDLPNRRISFSETYAPAPRPADDFDLPPARKARSGELHLIDDCQIVDARNWSCEDRGIGDENISMSNGALFYNYFTDSRRYELRDVLKPSVRACLSLEWRRCGDAVREIFADPAA